MAAGVASLLSPWFLGRIAVFLLFLVVAGAFASRPALNGAAFTWGLLLASIPCVVAVLLSLWSGKNWSWWVATMAATVLAGLALMCQFHVLPRALEPGVAMILFLFEAPLPLFMGSLVVMALLALPSTRRWILLCYHLRSWLFTEPSSADGWQLIVGHAGPMRPREPGLVRTGVGQGPLAH